MGLLGDGPGYQAIGNLPSLEIRYGLEGRAPDVGAIGEHGRHDEQPRGVREVEAPGGAAAEREHGGVVGVGGGLGSEVRPEREPSAALAWDAHLAEPPSALPRRRTLRYSGCRVSQSLVRPTGRFGSMGVGRRRVVW